MRCSYKTRHWTLGQMRCPQGKQRRFSWPLPLGANALHLGRISSTWAPGHHGPDRVVCTLERLHAPSLLPLRIQDAFATRRTPMKAARGVMVCEGCDAVYPKRVL